MVYVYLGLFSSIANWVLKHVLSPIVEWLGGILNSLFEWIVNKLILPALEGIILPILESALTLIYKALSSVIYMIFGMLLEFLNCIGAAFDSFIGLEPIYYNDKPMMLIDLVFTDSAIGKVFLYMNFIGFAMCLMLSVIAVTRSTLDFEFEGRKPVSKVLAHTFTGMFHLFTLQIFVFFMYKLTGAILMSIKAAVQYAMTPGSSEPTLGGIIFCVASLYAAKDKQYNLPNSIAINDFPRKAYYEGTASLSNVEEVGKLFAYDQFDYVIGFLVAIFMVLIMGACLIVFLRRLFDMLLLYVLAPFFAAAYPLDDGEHFAKWREQFIGRGFSGFGMVLAMKLYIMMTPLIMENGLVFSTPGKGGIASSPEFDYVVKIIFLAGGAWAIFKSGPMITSLISESVGRSEAEDAKTGFAATAFLGGAAVSKMGTLSWAAMKKIGQKISGGGGGEGKDAGADQKDSGKNSKGSNLFSGSKNSSSKNWKPGASAASKKKDAASAAASAIPSITAKAKDASKAPLGKPSISVGDRKSAAPGIGGAAKSVASGIGGAAKSGASGGAPKTAFFKKTEGGVEKSYLGGLIKRYSYTTTDGNGNEVQKSGLGVNLGFLGQYGSSEHGKGFSVLGCSVRKDASGSYSWSVPGFKFSAANDGQRHLEKVNISPIGLKIQADANTGEKHLMNLGALGISRERDENGKYHYSSVMGFSRSADAEGHYHVSGVSGLYQKELQADGQYHTTSVLGGLYSKTYAMGADGELHKTTGRVMGHNVYENNSVLGYQKMMKEKEDKQKFAELD